MKQLFQKSSNIQTHLPRVSFWLLPWAAGQTTGIPCSIRSSLGSSSWIHDTPPYPHPYATTQFCPCSPKTSCFSCAGLSGPWNRLWSSCFHSRLPSQAFPSTASDTSQPIPWAIFSKVSLISPVSTNFSLYSTLRVFTF